MFDTFLNRLEITGTLTAITALRISAGRSTEPIGSDLPVIKDALGQPLIPGSSFKGALRSRLESFLRSIDPVLACDPTDEENWSITSTQMTALLKQYDKRDKQLSERIETETDFVSLIFGSPWIASKLQLRDLTVKPETWYEQYQERDGVSIDRDTETAADQKLYSYQVVPADVQFSFQAVVENAKPFELGLLMFGLQQFEQQQIPLGGGRSRGLGIVQLDLEQLNWIDACTQDGTSPDPTKVMGYLEALLADDGSSPYQDGMVLRSQWQDAFVNYLRQENWKPTSTLTANHA